MTESVSLSDAQLQRILDSIDAAKHSGIHWETVIPVFVSALLAMCVGIALEYFKGYRERNKVSKERKRKELTQLNVAATAMGYNVESLLHIVMQQILPHHQQSNTALAALRAGGNDAAQVRVFLEKMDLEFRAMMTKCPEPHFIDLEFFKEIPFILEKDPELLKVYGWVINYSEALIKITAEQNKRIDIAITIDNFDFNVLEEQIRVQSHLSDQEVVISFQLLRQIVVVCSKLKKLTLEYNKELGVRLIVKFPAPLGKTMEELRHIAEAVSPGFPPPEPESSPTTD